MPKLQTANEETVDDIIMFCAETISISSFPAIRRCVMSVVCERRTLTFIAVVVSLRRRCHLHRSNSRNWARQTARWLTGCDHSLLLLQFERHQLASARQELVAESQIARQVRYAEYLQGMYA